MIKNFGNRESEIADNDNLDNPDNADSETTTSASYINNAKTVRSPAGPAHTAPLLETTNFMLTTAQYNAGYGPGQDMVVKRMRNTKTKNTDIDYLDDSDNADSERVTWPSRTSTGPDSTVNIETTPTAGTFSNSSVGTPLANQIINVQPMEQCAAYDQPSMTNDINMRSQILAQYYGPAYPINYNPYNKEYSPYAGNDGTQYRHLGVQPEAARRERKPMRVRCFPHPGSMYQTAVWSKAPRHNHNNHPPTTTDTVTDNPNRWGSAKPRTRHPTAVRSPAPRLKHTTKEPTVKTPRRPRPLHIITPMMSIATILLRNGGVEPCSPPANNTKQTTYVMTKTHKGLKNGGVEQRSPPA